MQELRSADFGVGYWHGVPLSVGRVVEDALALTWRLRGLIAPIVVVQMIVTGCSYLLIAGIIDPAKTTSALHALAVAYQALTTRQFAEWGVYYCVNILLIVVLAKVFYAAYHDHVDLAPSKAGGFMLGALRVIAVQLLYLFLLVLSYIVVIVVPALLLGLIAKGIGMSAASGAAALATLAVGSVALIIFCSITLIFLVLGAIGSQYVITAAMLRRDNLLLPLRECLRLLASRKHLKRLLILSALDIALIFVVSIIPELVRHLLAALGDRAAALVVCGALQALLATPVLTAFSIVFYVDARHRLTTADPASA